MNVKDVLGAGLFVLIGLGVLAYGGYDYTQAQEDVESAVEVEGTVENTDIEEVTTRRDTDDDGVKETKTDYVATVEYTYTHDGETYTNDQVYPGDTTDTRFGSRSGAEDLVNDYSEGETVTVYVTADDPGTSFLVNDVKLLNYAIMGVFGGVFTLAGVANLFKSG
jgi:hypothetical protein